VDATEVTATAGGLFICRSFFFSFFSLLFEDSFHVDNFSAFVLSTNSTDKMFLLWSFAIFTNRKTTSLNGVVRSAVASMTSRASHSDYHRVQLYLKGLFWQEKTHHATGGVGKRKLNCCG